VLVLQGNAAIKLRCGGRFYSYLIRKCFLVTTLKELLKSANIAKVTVEIKGAQFFLTHSGTTRRSADENNQQSNIFYFCTVHCRFSVRR